MADDDVAVVVSAARESGEMQAQCGKRRALLGGVAKGSSGRESGR